MKIGIQCIGFSLTSASAGQVHKRLDHLLPVIDEDDTDAILAELKRLRTTDETIYLRNGSINRINGIIGMSFSCDGAHYIDHFAI